MSSKVVNYPKSPKKMIKKALVFLLFACSFVAAVCLFLGQTKTYREIQGEINELSSTLEAIRAENEGLKEQIFLLQDNEYIEMQARKHLGMVRPGEIIFHVGD